MALFVGMGGHPSPEVWTILKPQLTGQIEGTEKKILQYSMGTGAARYSAFLEKPFLGYQIQERQLPSHTKRVTARFDTWKLADTPLSPVYEVMPPSSSHMTHLNQIAKSVSFIDGLANKLSFYCCLYQIVLFHDSRF